MNDSFIEMINTGGNSVVTLTCTQIRKTCDVPWNWILFTNVCYSCWSKNENQIQKFSTKKVILKHHIEEEQFIDQAQQLLITTN